MDEKVIDTSLDAHSKQTLDVAWRRYAQLDFRATRLEGSLNRGGLWIVILGILFVLMAVLFDTYGEMLTTESELVVKALLIITPLVSSILAVFSRKSGNNERQIMRVGAEAILKDIYLYRTILAGFTQRRNWLGSRLVIIQKQLSAMLGRELSLKPYDGEVPPGYSPDNFKGDPGFSDLSWNDYMTYRLENRLAWVIKDKQGLQRRRTRILIAVLVLGGIGALLVAFGGALTVWSAIVGVIAMAQYGWNELRIIDEVLTNEEKFISGLMNLYEFGNEQPEEERFGFEFHRLVYIAEDELWDFQSKTINLFDDGILTFDADLVVWSVLSEGVETSDHQFFPEEDSIEKFIPDDDLLLDVEEDENVQQDESQEELIDKLEAEELSLGDGVIASTETKLEDQKDIEDEGTLFVSLVSESSKLEQPGSIIDGKVQTQDVVGLEDGYDQQTSESEVEEVSRPENEFAEFFAEMRTTVREELAGKSINKGTSVSEINEILSRFQPLDDIES